MRFRTISTRIWGDEKFRSLSGPQPNAKYLFIYLLTGPHTTSLPGLSAARMESLAAHLEWLPKPFAERFQELSSKGMAKADWEAGLVWLPNSLKYQPPPNPNVALGWARQIEELPECRLLDESIQYFTSFMERLGEPFAKPFHERFQNRIPNGLGNGTASQEQEQEQEQEQRTEGESERILAPGPPAAPANGPPAVRPSKGRPAHPNPSQASLKLSDELRAAAPSLATWPAKAPDAVAEIWNFMAGEWRGRLPRVRGMTEGRRKAIRSAVAQQDDPRFWIVTISKVFASEFLTGLSNGNGTGVHANWKASFDWLFGKKQGVENWIKVAEGRYSA